MSQLMEQILSRENMLLAYKKVKANKGAGGIDNRTRQGDRNLVPN